MHSKKTTRSSKKNSNLKPFVREGIWSSACEGFAEANFNAFSTFLMTSSDKISYLSASQNLTGCWLQLWSEKLVNYLGSQKRLVLICVSLQVFILALLLPMISLGISPCTFMGFVLAFGALGGLSGPVWNTWTSQLLPKKRRGFCFGIRNQRTYPAHFISILIGGFIIQKLELTLFGTQASQYGFLAVFGFGMVSKVLSLKHLWSQPETPFIRPQEVLGPQELIRLAYNDSQMGKTALFFGAMGFAINISAPLQVPFLLHSLHTSYIQISCVSAAYIGARFFAAPSIGKWIDTYGPRSILLYSALLMPFMSLGWSCARSYEFILLTQIFAGLVWTTFELCSFSYLTETTHPENRQRAFSLKHVAWNLGGSSGAILGGILEPLFVNSQGVFWTSTIFRTIAALLVFRMLGASDLQPNEGIGNQPLSGEIS
jgi:MFS family permease